MIKKEKKSNNNDTMEIDSTILILPNMDLECNICMNTISNPVQCVNGHLFCQECVSPHLSAKGTCPSCINMSSNTDDYFERISFFPKERVQTYPNEDINELNGKGEIHKDNNYLLNKCYQLSDSLEALRKRIKYKFNK